MESPDYDIISNDNDDDIILPKIEHVLCSRQNYGKPILVVGDPIGMYNLVKTLIEKRKFNDPRMILFTDELGLFSKGEEEFNKLLEKFTIIDCVTFQRNINPMANGYEFKANGVISKLDGYGEPVDGDGCCDALDDQPQKGFRGYSDGRNLRGKGFIKEIGKQTRKRIK